MKGIILSGGSGTRLHPITLSVSKQLLPVYDKPMIFYPLSVLMLSKIRDIIIISTPEHIDLYKNMLGNGNQYGLSINYKIQTKPEGIAQSFLIANEFIENEKVCLVLGDNIFYGENFSEKLENATKREEGATVFAYGVKDPERFGVVEFDDTNKALSIEEKPEKPKSNYAVTGLYFYDEKVLEYAKSIKPSNRGELEISDINAIYLRNQDLNVEVLGRGFSWLDSGTHDSLLESSNFVKTIQNNTGNYVACLEEIAFRNKWITQKDIEAAAKKYEKNSYGKYLKSLLI